MPFPWRRQRPGCSASVNPHAPESMNNHPEYIRKLLPLLRKQWPKTLCEVNHSNPLELMVGVILSAQSTDKRINELTKTLFKKYRSAEDYVNVPPSELEHDIQPAGFFR